METELSDKQKAKLIDVLGKERVEDLIVTVNKIETSVPTTKNHYGAYMAILSMFGKNKVLVGNLIILLGANREGVKDALEACK